MSVNGFSFLHFISETNYCLYLCQLWIHQLRISIYCLRYCLWLFLDKWAFWSKLCFTSIIQISFCLSSFFHMTSFTLLIIIWVIWSHLERFSSCLVILRWQSWIILIQSPVSFYNLIVSHIANTHAQWSLLGLYRINTCMVNWWVSVGDMPILRSSFLLTVLLCNNLNWL